MGNENLRRTITFVGATGRKIRLQMRDPDTGAPNDISSVDTATISGRFTGATEYTIQATALTIEEGTDGWVYFFPATSEVATDGDMRCQVRLLSGTEPDYSDPFILEIQEPEHYTP
jgi:hypothetical protein